MGERGYALIDFELPAGVWPDRDRVVRFMEYVRANFHQIVPGVPAECELDLFASGHAHNSNLLPLLGLYAPEHAVPDVFEVTGALSDWCAARTPNEIEMILGTTDAPSWEELLRVRVHPPR